MGKKKVVLDTNVLISAVGFSGNEREVLRKCINGEVSLFLTEAILKELERVLEYPKLNFTQAQKDALKLILVEVGCLVPATKGLNIITEDPEDNRFLEAAIAAEADFLITGNKHLLKVKEFGKTKIVRAPQFLRFCR